MATNSTINTITKWVYVNGTNDCTVTLNLASTNYTHKVKFSVNGHSHTETLAKGVRSVSYVIPNSWKDSFPNSQTGDMTVTLTTYSGSNQVGNGVAVSVLLRVIGNEIPTFTCNMSDTSGTYASVHCYVAGKSILRIGVYDLAFQYGATLKSIDFVVNGVTYTGKKNILNSASTLKAGNQNIKVVVTDSRGLSATLINPITVEEYSVPSISWSISRYKANGEYHAKDDEGEYAGIWYSVSITEIGTNRINEIVIDYTSEDGLDTGTVTLSNAEDIEYILADTEKAYTYTITATDKLGSKSRTKSLSTASTIYDIIKGGDGICFGGVARYHKTLESMWNLIVNGTIKQTNPIYQRYSGDKYKLASGNSMSEVMEIPQLENGVYSLDIAVAFPENSIGIRTIALYYSSDNGTTKTRIGYGIMDVRQAINGNVTICHIRGIEKFDGTRRLYLYAQQNSGAEQEITVRTSYFRL